MSDFPDFHRPFDTRRLGHDPVREEIATSEGECLAIAAFLDIVAVNALSASVAISRWSNAGIEVNAQLRAEVVQACVVTLEPVAQSIDEPFHLTFLPPHARKVEPRTVAEAEVIVQFDEEDPPDDLEGPVLDLGPLIVEQLALALDPYPRAKGAALSDEFAAGEARKDSPFANLARLKDK